MSTGMGFLAKYRIKIISKSMEIGTASPKITQQNLNFPLSNLRSPLYVHIAKFPCPWILGGHGCDVLVHRWPWVGMVHGMVHVNHGKRR
jgi:hypothetical protein